MISAVDARNLLALLERVTLAANEVDVFIDLRSKLQYTATAPAPSDQAAAPTPTAEHADMPTPGVTVGPRVPETNEA